MLILKNISQIVTPTGKTAKKGGEMDRVTVIENAEIHIDNGVFTYVGQATDKQNGDVVDCKGCAVIPGFVDSHTHLVFGGNRAGEFSMRQAGATYMEIMNSGGGIASSVKATRLESEQQLFDSAVLRLNELSGFGVTTVEVKSGYGLDKDTELKQLRVIDRLRKESALDIVPTFMGAHSIPAEYKGRSGEYINFIINDVLPDVKKENLAEFVDIFCEKGVFSVDESLKLLTAAKSMGFKTKIHADEIVSTGGSELAAKIGCASADHLLHASEQGIKALASSDTIATLLPLTAFCLKEGYADARRLIDSGAAVALATDFNPGSCFSSSVPLLIGLSVIYMGMSINEVITALTLNGACAACLGEKTGSIEVGKQADLNILKYPSVDFLAYHTGVNCIAKTIKSKG